MSKKPQGPTLTEIAARIAAHLRRLESSRTTNPVNKWKTTKYYYAFARRAGNRVRITYVTHQGGDNVTRDEALAYLAKLDAGFTGKHWEAERGDN
jgi:hypothetical protein